VQRQQRYASLLALFLVALFEKYGNDYVMRALEFGLRNWIWKFWFLVALSILCRPLTMILLSCESCDYELSFFLFLFLCVMSFVLFTFVFIFCVAIWLVIMVDEYEPMGSGSGSGSTPTSKSVDPARAHGQVFPSIQARGTIPFVCTYCQKHLAEDGMTRLKEHLAGVKGNVAACKHFLKKSNGK